MPVELLLSEDVKDLGKMGDVVDVSKGYARNFLLPRGLGVKLTSENRRQIEVACRNQEREQAEQVAKIQQTVEALTDVSVTVSAQANEEGHLFGSVGAHDISEALKAKGHDVPERAILLESPLKEVGVYQVDIQLTREVDAKSSVKVWVIQE